jgi:hypothetical protein
MAQDRCASCSSSSSSSTSSCGSRLGDFAAVQTLQSTLWQLHCAFVHEQR